MGQRLIITNHLNGEPINNIYYHWSAYTISAIQEAINLKNEIVNGFENCYNDKLSVKDNFNLILLNTSAGIATEHYEKSAFYIESLLGKPYDNTHVNRNNGLIAYHPQEIMNNEGYGEGFLDIYWVINDKNQINLEDSEFEFGNVVNIVFYGGELLDNITHDSVDTNSDDHSNISDQDIKDNYDEILNDYELSDIINITNNLPENSTIKERLIYIMHNKAINTLQPLVDIEHIFDTLNNTPIWYNPREEELQTLIQ